jgi:hypothetical protein
MSWLLNHPSLGQSGHDFPTCAMHPRLDRPDWHTHHFANFVVAHLTMMKQIEHLSVFITQIAQCQVNFFSQQLSIPFEVRVVGDGQVKGMAGWLANPPRQLGAATIAGNGKQPRFELSRRVPTMQVFHHPNEGFLCAVLRILTLPEHAHAETKHRPLEPLHKIDLGGGTSRDAPTNETS